MSRPIDIPLTQKKRQRTSVDKPLFAAEEGPYMGYIEIFESGRIYQALSSGSAKFVEVKPKCRLPNLAFIVEKDRFSKSITIDIISAVLGQAVQRAILSQTPSTTSTSLDFETLVGHYDALKAHLQCLQARAPFDDETAEMRLLVEDLLLERALYEGIEMEILHQKQIIHVTHLHDIHSRSISIGLDEIEDCFKLGLVPDDINEQYLESLNAKYAKFAREGDFSALWSLCEPVVRSGEIELQYNPSLLLEVLDNGSLDIYQYMLDLVDRTKTVSVDVPDAQFSDVTFDPFYIAIRLGQLDTVQAFVDDNATFEGYVFDNDDAASQDRIFTPLTTAIYWEQPDVVRVLLKKSNLIYSSALPQAIGMALANGSETMMQLLLDYQSQVTSPVRDPFASFSTSEPSISVSPQSLHLSPPPVGLNSRDASRTISGITNGLCNTDRGIPSQRTSTVQTGHVHHDEEFLKHFQEPSAIAPIISINSVPIDELHPPKETLHPDKTLNVPGFSSSTPYIQHTLDHRSRRQLGQSFTQRLEQQCTVLMRVCQSHNHLPEYDELYGHFTSTAQVLSSGIDCYRNITKNKPPSGLAQILHGLLVADSLCHRASHASSNNLHADFVGDLGRWETQLCEVEQTMFHEIARVLWGVDTVSLMSTQTNTRAELYQFQDLIQNLVSLEYETDLSPISSGTRLRTAQRKVQTRNRHMHRPCRSHQSRLSAGSSFHNIGSVLAQLTMDSDSNSDDEIDMNDFVHLDAPSLEARPHFNPKPTSAPACTSWKNVHPIVVLLLASVAFSVVLTMISATQDEGESRSARAFQETPPGYARSCVIVNDFLSFRPESDGQSVCDSGIDVRPPRGRWMREMKRASQRRSALESLNPRASTTSANARKLATTRAPMSSPSGSSFLSTDFSSPDTSRSRERRYRCTSHHCDKTFSSVSNRNKHVRDGCAFRDKKGYPCRNDNCHRILTTNWYRNTHEQTRCPFRKNYDGHFLEKTS